MTPLLQAVKAVNEQTGIQAIKRLLLLGADRYAINEVGADAK